MIVICRCSTCNKLTRPVLNENTRMLACELCGQPHLTMCVLAVPLAEYDGAGTPYELKEVSAGNEWGDA